MESASLLTANGAFVNIYGALEEEGSLPRPQRFSNERKEGHKEIGHISDVPLLCEQLPNGKTIFFSEKAVAGKGDCGFISLGITRKKLVNCLMPLMAERSARRTLRKEIQQAVETGEFKRPKLQSLLQTRTTFMTWYDEKTRHIKEKFPSAHIDSTQTQEEQRKSLIDWLEQQGEQEEAATLRYIKRSCREIERTFKETCQSKKIAKAYITELGKKIWLGYQSALLYATHNRISLYIWRKRTNKQQVVLMHHYEDDQPRQVIHMLHTQRYTHFNLLVERPPPIIQPISSVEENKAHHTLDVRQSPVVQNASGGKNNEANDTLDRAVVIYIWKPAYANNDDHDWRHSTTGHASIELGEFGKDEEDPPYISLYPPETTCGCCSNEPFHLQDRRTEILDSHNLEENTCSCSQVLSRIFCCCLWICQSKSAEQTTHDEEFTIEGLDVNAMKEAFESFEQNARSKYNCVCNSQHEYNCSELTVNLLAHGGLPLTEMLDMTRARKGCCRRTQELMLYLLFPISIAILDYFAYKLEDYLEPHYSWSLANLFRDSVNLTKLPVWCFWMFYLYINLSLCNTERSVLCKDIMRVFLCISGAMTFIALCFGKNFILELTSTAIKNELFDASMRLVGVTISVITSIKQSCTQFVVTPEELSRVLKRLPDALREQRDRARGAKGDAARAKEALYSQDLVTGFLARALRWVPNQMTLRDEEESFDRQLDTLGSTEVILVSSEKPKNETHEFHYKLVRRAPSSTQRKQALNDAVVKPSLQEEKRGASPTQRGLSSNRYSFLHHAHPINANHSITILSSSEDEAGQTRRSRCILQ